MVIRYNNTRSFNAEDNKTDEEKRIKELEKKVKQLEMENDIKASGTTTREKVDLIISNREKYSISAMCEFRGLT